MNYVKRVISALFICIFAVFIASCENSEADSSENGKGAQETIQFGFNLDISSSHGEAAQLFKEEVEEETNGQIEVELYPNQQLGTMPQQIERVQTGSTEITLQGVSTISNFSEPIGLVELPYLFPNDEVMWEVLDGEVGQEIFRELESVNMVGLSYFSQGFRQITNNAGPIHDPEDVSALQLRTMPAGMLLETLDSFGANPTTIDLGELYSAFQQGVVDGGDNSLETIEATSQYEVQEYLTISNHNFLAFALVANEDWFKNLSEENQEIISEAADNAGEFALEYIRQNEERVMPLLKEEMIVNELTEQEIEKFREASQAVYDKYAEDERNRKYIEKLQQAVSEVENN